MIHFKIEGRAQPQGRPRAVRMGAGVRMYDPPKSRAYKQMVAAKVRSYMQINGIEMIEEPLIVHLNFYFKPPKSYTKKKLKLIEEGKFHYTKLPDTDNLAKSILDSCNKLLFKDDAQIVSLTSSKHYGKEDYVDVKVEVIKSGDI
jgi:Holliday junction resolvase